MDLPTNAYFNGKIVPYAEAKVGVLTHGLNYGTDCFCWYSRILERRRRTDSLSSGLMITTGVS